MYSHRCFRSRTSNSRSLYDKYNSKKLYNKMSRKTIYMEPRRNVEFDVIHPLTGQVVDRKQVRAGEQFTLSGADAYVLKGRYV